ncbi:MAG TPA: ABC transporter ATP-binding protein [Ignavibacteriaceae bacterium]|nr:ABC transporter ATP-binding protein [Ignavibacteriaceae bacterium]
MEEKVIEVINLTKVFREVKAVEGLNLNVNRGDVFGFLGPNGAGKSTTIRMLVSLIAPQEGSIKILGRSLNQNKREISGRVGAIVEKPDFYNYLSAYKNLEILGRISGKSISKKRIIDTLELVGLAARFNSKVKTYSHGMKQRLGIAQALLHDPELIILDEPTTGLDPQGLKEIRDLIIHLSKTEGKTIFLSSHILSEVELVANRMIIINKGKTIVEGNVSELLNSSNVKVTFEVDNVEEAKKVLETTRWSVKIRTFSDKEIIFELDSDEIAELNKYFVESGVSVKAIIPSRSLEDYFLKITSGTE